MMRVLMEYELLSAASWFALQWRIVLIIGCAALVGRWNDSTQHRGQELLAKVRWDVPNLSSPRARK
jgi:hypothetical protein